VNAPALLFALAAAAFVPTLAPGDTVPAIPLVDQSGRAFSVRDLRGSAVVLSFIYTRCADARMCPLVSSKFARIQAATGAAPVRLLEITLDPAFDTPRVLRAYGTAFGQDPRRWTLATGAPASIDELAARLNVATKWTAPGTLVHTESVTVLDPAGRIVQTIDGSAWTPDGVLAIARASAGGAPSLGGRIGLWLGAAIESCGGGTAGMTTLGGLALLFAAIGLSAILLFRALYARPSREVRKS
jgi:cytochrome oxidase Cu insertion factor (SCO1/SenC/PrrC family)